MRCMQCKYSYPWVREQTLSYQIGLTRMDVKDALEAVRRIESSAPRQNKRAKMNERAMIKIINQKKKSVFRKKLLARKQAYALTTRMLNNLERNLIARKELYSESYSKFSLKICPQKGIFYWRVFYQSQKGVVVSCIKFNLYSSW